MIFYKRKHFKSIVKVDYINSSSNVEILTNNIKEIEDQIVENSRQLIQAQAVRIRSAITPDKNFIDTIQKKYVDDSVIKSISFYQKRLKELNLERKNLVDRIDRIKGNYWKKKILNFIVRIFLIILVSIVAISFILASLYLFPIILFLLFLLWSAIKFKHIRFN